jgi:hypothetical protein
MLHTDQCTPSRCALFVGKCPALVDDESHKDSKV